MTWPKNIIDAKRLQELHRMRVAVVSLPNEPRYIAGVDAAFSEDHVYAVACLYRLPELVLVGQTTAVTKATFPYVPGYLFFREGPAIIAALKKLSKKPDLILVDGQGIAHPLGIGSASHLGVLLGIATIGCAKTRLIGEFREPGKKKGNWSELRDQDRILGAVLRTRDGVRPLFVSPGHKVELADAIRITLACTAGYRIPEPLRCADILSRKMKAGR